MQQSWWKRTHPKHPVRLLQLRKVGISWSTALEPIRDSSADIIKSTCRVSSMSCGHLIGRLGAVTARAVRGQPGVRSATWAAPRWRVPGVRSTTCGYPLPWLWSRGEFRKRAGSGFKISYSVEYDFCDKVLLCESEILVHNLYWKE